MNVQTIRQFHEVSAEHLMAQQAVAEVAGDWFKENQLSDLPYQADQNKLIDKANSLFKANGYSSEEQARRMRAKWYASVVKLRSTRAGWLMDKQVQRKYC